MKLVLIRTQVYPGNHYILPTIKLCIQIVKVEINAPLELNVYLINPALNEYPELRLYFSAFGGG